MISSIAKDLKGFHNALGSKIISKEEYKDDFDLVVKSGLCNSKREAKQLEEQTTWIMFPGKEYIFIQIGKKRKGMVKIV